MAQQTPYEWYNQQMVNKQEQNKLPGTLSVRNQEVPFNVTFRWGGKIIIVELENGEDVLRLADVFSNMLSANNILHKVINQ